MSDEVIDFPNGLTHWDNVTQYVFDLEDLVKWLAITYGNNDPVWPLIDQYGTPMPHNTRLAATWLHVVRGGVTQRIATEVPSEQEGHYNDG